MTPLFFICKAKTGDWEVTANGVAATVETDGTFIVEDLSLSEGPNTITASGEDPGTMETDTHQINVTKLPQEDVTCAFDDRGNMTEKADSSGTTSYIKRGQEGSPIKGAVSIDKRVPIQKSFKRL